MTRINAGIPPAELSDKHLLAEHREIKRIPNMINSGKAIFKDIPKEFTLGKGHVKFFYNKVKFLFHRYNAIRDECYLRGFNVIDYQEAFMMGENSLKCWFDWKPTKKANELIRKRINQRNKESMAKKANKGKLIHITDIDSSNLAEMLYDPNEETLQSTFKHGGTYKYLKVSKKEFDDILRAESMGKAHNQIIVTKKEFTKIK